MIFMHRWEKEARDLVASLQFKDTTANEAMLWNYLRMCLDEIDRHRAMEEKKLLNEQNDFNTKYRTEPFPGYGDGY